MNYQQVQTAAIARRIRFLSRCVILATLFVIARLFYLQINLQHYFTDRGQRNFLRVETVQSPRGNILDRNGTLLATNRPVARISWIGSGRRYLLDEQKLALIKLSTILNRSLENEEALMARIKNAERHYGEISIASDVTFNELSKVTEAFPNHTNIVVTTDFQRFYPHGQCASHLLGYLGRHIDLAGKTGLEKLLEESLKGHSGTILKTIDSVGKSIAQIELEKSRCGSDIKTTTNRSLQHLCESIFPEQRRGAIILMNPHDGDLYAVVSRPAFDPNQFLKPISHAEWAALQEKGPFMNRAFGACYPPGSIFKLITISAALETGLITPDATWHCKGYSVLGRRKYWCNRHAGHGELTTMNAVAQSCNIPFFEVGKQIDIDLLARYAGYFGLGMPSNVILPEKNGIVPSRSWKYENLGEQWWTGETLSVAIGQSFLLTTPIQIARMIASIFTSHLVKPRVLMHEPIEQIPLALRPETIKFLKKSMKKVVTTGTGRRLRNVKDVKVYAKTSTAQTSSAAKRRLGTQYLEHGWFAGCFSYADETPLVVVILVEHAGSAQVATTIAQNLLNGYKKLVDNKILSMHAKAP